MAAVAVSATGTPSGGAPGVGGPGGGGPTTASSNNNALITESQRRIDALSLALRQMQTSTTDAGRCCDQLSRRSRHLDSLTSPASDASARMTQASSNLGTTLSMMKDAREKFDTVSDCEPAIDRLLRGAREAVESRKKDAKGAPALTKRGSAAMIEAPKKAGGGGDDNATTATGVNLTEQDVYAAADSMEIIRDAYQYFLQRTSWRSTPSALGGLERVHQLGVDAMCLLVTSHLSAAGPAVRMKRVVKGEGGATATKNETSAETRARLSAALQNRDLMKSVGEYEEYLPLETRPVRELRAIFECLGGDGSHLGNPMSADRPVLHHTVPGNKVVRTEKVGSGGYTNLVKKPLKTGYPHLDAYGESRKSVAFASVDGYYRHVRAERRKSNMKRRNQGAMSGGPSTGLESGDVDAAARDAVRCLEHAMVVVAGEKSIYRCVVSPTSSHTHDESKVPTEYKHALVASYSYVVAAIVDRTMDIIESVFLKEAAVNASFSSSSNVGDDSGHGSSSGASVDIRGAASSAAAGLRMLDGVRMLGPSLAKLCDMSSDRGSNSGRGDGNMSVAGNLCISIHRTTVKNTARTLENLAKAIQNDPLDGEKHRPRDARVAAVSSDVVRAVKLISPFISAYKSVTKRRALPWDPNIGDDAGDLDSFVRFLIMRLLNSLQGKALNYTRDVGADSLAKSNLFMINNTFYLTETLGANERTPVRVEGEEIDAENFRVESPWFKDKVGKIFETEKNKYLAHWEILNNHLTSVDKNDLSYQSDRLLSLESGRLLKTRFSGFIEDFEKTYAVHKELSVIDPKLREMLMSDVRSVFVPRYKRFFEKYSRIQFSKKNMDQYLKYPPQRVDAMIGDLYSPQ